MKGQSTWLTYSREIQQRSIQACPLEVASAKELRTQIFTILKQAHDEGFLDTNISEIYQLLKIIPQDRRQVMILGGLEKAGTKNFNRSKDIPHFLRVDGCWFDFSIIIDESREPAEIIGFNFEIRFPESVPIKFFRFELNLPGHHNQANGLRFHVHPGSDDIRVNSPPMSPVEILHLFLYGFEISEKMRV